MILRGAPVVHLKPKELLPCVTFRIELLFALSPTHNQEILNVWIELVFKCHSPITSKDWIIYP
jgi:hypothetical protein